ncbi:MAG: FGGY family carbohydrate kinase [Christensenellaceae bacterium]|jgi:xylulokinase
MYYLMGIDLGTSSTKTAIYTEEGALLSLASAEYPVVQPAPGYMEQDPALWWQAVKNTIKKALFEANIASTDIAGIGLTGQMQGLVMLDAAGALLSPTIIWCDGRTEAECSEMTEKIGRDTFLSVTGNPAMIGLTAGKLLWVKNHLPEVYQKCAHILLPKDYIRYLLTGEMATDYNDASAASCKMNCPNK